jgi:hypothetical protein
MGFCPRFWVVAALYARQSAPENCNKVRQFEKKKAADQQRPNRKQNIIP